MSETLTVLAIDDEPINLSILSYELEDHGFQVISAEDGEQGWEVLQEHYESIAVILLDRMMPNMNGMEFMKRLRTSETYSHIPVIMQTAAAQDKQIIEGIEAGVYYYLTKPFKPEVLIAIVQAAIRDSRDRSRVQNMAVQPPAALRGLNEARFEIRTLEDAQQLASQLSALYPDPGSVVMGLSELMVNAIEHGNLGISYDEKSELLMQNRWQEEIADRLKAPEYSDRIATVQYRRDEENISVVITDQGDGFHWQQYLEFNPHRMTDLHGRGIAIARKVSFDDMHYNETGNEVEAIVRLAS